MKVLIVSPEAEDAGGVQNVADNLSRYLLQHGHEVAYFHSSKDAWMKSNTSSEGTSTFDMNLQLPFGDRPWIVSLPLFLVRFPIALFQLVRMIRKNRIEIINVHYPAGSACYFAICRCFLPIGVITSVHGADLFPGGKRIPKYPRALQFLLRYSDRITAPSQSFRSDVVRLFPSLDRKAVSIHNGVRFEEMENPAGDNDTAALDHFLLCIAMHNEKKGLDVLLRAFAFVEKDYPFLKLALVGDGPLRPELEKLAQTLGISSKVHFLGRKGRPQVADLMQRCEIFVLPSRAEPFGIVLIEAMACAKPVVATKVGGIPEIIENGKNGILVEPDNPEALSKALVTMLTDNELRSTLAKKGYEDVHKTFSSEAMGSSYQNLFETVIGSRRSQVQKSSRISV